MKENDIWHCSGGVGQLLEENGERKCEDLKVDIHGEIEHFLTWGTGMLMLVPLMPDWDWIVNRKPEWVRVGQWRCARTIIIDTFRMNRSRGHKHVVILYIWNGEHIPGLLSLYAQERGNGTGEIQQATFPSWELSLETRDRHGFGGWKGWKGGSQIHSLKRQGIKKVGLTKMKRMRIWKRIAKVWKVWERTLAPIFRMDKQGYHVLHQNAVSRCYFAVTTFQMNCWTLNF